MPDEFCSECRPPYRCDDCTAAALLRHVRSQPREPLACHLCGVVSNVTMGWRLQFDHWTCTRCQTTTDHFSKAAWCRCPSCRAYRARYRIAEPT
jgi:hypothetical protein